MTQLIAAQGENFEVVGKTQESSLQLIGNYYDSNHLKPNPSKTQVCAFHLHNRLANQILNKTWKGVEIEHTSFLKYLEVTLDRFLTYKKHCNNEKSKISARNSLLRKLIGSNWRANAYIPRVSALALCFSIGEYASPVWYRSTHAKKIEMTLSESCRLITGCLKSTPLHKVFPIADIASPYIRFTINKNLT